MTLLILALWASNVAEFAVAVAPKPAAAPFSARDAAVHQAAWAKHLSRPREITTPIGLRLVLIPPGEFMMGSPATEAERDPKDEQPHSTRITRPYYLAVCETTQDEFDRLMGFNPSYRAARMARTKQNFDVDTSRFPVERVSWDTGSLGMMRATFRSVGMPNYRFVNYGFRLVLSAEGP